MAGVAASEARSFEQWQATLTTASRQRSPLASSGSPRGFPRPRARVRLSDYLEYSFVTWTPRAKIIVCVSAVYYALLSLASMLDWSWYLCADRLGLPAPPAPRKDLPPAGTRVEPVYHLQEPPASRVGPRALPAAYS
eukprot:scaffold47004_cov52-Phaeocystis_antarctica.AAC.2